MRKLLLIFLFVFFVNGARAVDCPNGYKPDDIGAKPMEIQTWGCKNLSNGLFFDLNKKFYIDSVPCGTECDLDGKNCKTGVCNVQNCLPGYTELKKFKNYQHVCYNPKLNLSYDKDKKFYINEIECGSECDKDGENCATGFCNASVCPKGFTEVRPNYLYGRNWCYNPKLKLSYDIDFYDKENAIFYYEDVECGKGCDFEGKNCKRYIEGRFCNIEDENLKCEQGFIPGEVFVPIYNCPGRNCYLSSQKEKIFGCTNKNTGISYSEKVLANNEITRTFAFDNQPCGWNCDLDGKNCKRGLCDPSECKDGFSWLPLSTDFLGYNTAPSTGAAGCGNPKDKIVCYKTARTGGKNKNYFEEDYPKKYLCYKIINGNVEWCGDNCDSDGKNCDDGIDCYSPASKRIIYQIKSFGIGEYTVIFAILLLFLALYKKIKANKI